jgi:peptide-methionine (S)-S-oxide reductase
MVFRHAAVFVALTLFCLVAESRAQEPATPDTTKSAPGATESAAPEAEKPGTPNATLESKSFTATPTAKSAKSLGEKKTASSAKTAKKPKSQQATFGGGCFWHVEADFERLNGVNSAVSGYAGGNVPYPTYEMVHEGITGHAEVVMVDFDPEVISYEDLLKVFWKIHDPTSVNRQGEDEGPQYRSVIFYHTEEQRLAALKSYRALTDRRAYRLPIVTQLAPLTAFYRAEDYHQNYYGGKPRTATRRKAASAKVKTARKTTKGKNSAAAAKRAADDSTTSAPSEAPAGNPEAASTP